MRHTAAASGHHSSSLITLPWLLGLFAKCLPSSSESSEPEPRRASNSTRAWQEIPPSPRNTKCSQPGLLHPYARSFLARPRPMALVMRLASCRCESRKNRFQTMTVPSASGGIQIPGASCFDLGSLLKALLVFRLWAICRRLRRRCCAFWFILSTREPSNLNRPRWPQVAVEAARSRNAAQIFTTTRPLCLANRVFAVAIPLAGAVGHIRRITSYE